MKPGRTPHPAPAAALYDSQGGRPEQPPGGAGPGQRHRAPAVSQVCCFPKSNGYSQCCPRCDCDGLATVAAPGAGSADATRATTRATPPAAPASACSSCRPTPLKRGCARSCSTRSPQAQALSSARQACSRCGRLAPLLARGSLQGANLLCALEPSSSPSLARGCWRRRWGPAPALAASRAPPARVPCTVCSYALMSPRVCCCSPT